jgi:2,4-dienoyl-CoA reductase-like NADH-dependent reductase (Old Yellow Enzyme family)
MSDSLGDGRGNPTDAQIRLYGRWAQGGVAVSIIGEVQGTPAFPEKPGNLLLGSGSDLQKLKMLANNGVTNGALLWLQLGHAGAMEHPQISIAEGPSTINISGLSCTALTREEVRSLPSEFARTACQAKDLGFGGIQIHAAHGFLLSQFLSPLFNKRQDEYGALVTSLMRVLLEVADDVRAAVGSRFPIALKLKTTDQLEGGFGEEDALDVISALDSAGIDIIDISGGTYFPGAKSASDSAGGGPYFVDFAGRARMRTKKPLMVTGGFKTSKQAVDAISDGNVDVIGLARALVLKPDLPNSWRSEIPKDPIFPHFTTPPEGGITAWYTMRLTQLAENLETTEIPDLETAIREYEDRDRDRVTAWKNHFLD